MNVLILSCNTGGGHNACAEALKEVFRETGDFCEIQDSLQFVSHKLSQFMSWGHATMYRHVPGLFQHGYDFAETHPKFLAEDSAVYKLLTAGTKKLHQHIRQGHFDAVIGTHVFSGLLLHRTMMEYPLNIRTAFVATDYTCSPGTATSKLHRYFISSASLIPEFREKGIPADNISVSGIPIRQSFYHKSDKAEAKKALELDPNRPHLLVMCGSMGCGPLKKLSALLCDRLGDSCEISIVCGTNEALRQALLRQHRNNPYMHIHGYINNMSALMDSADLYLTKPGGLSTSEAAAKCLPMVFIDAVSGCEDHNLRFFTELGGAVTAATVWELTELCCKLLHNEEKRAAMETALSSEGQKNAARSICDWLHRSV